MYHLDRSYVSGDWMEMWDAGKTGVAKGGCAFGTIDSAHHQEDTLRKKTPLAHSLHLHVCARSDHNIRRMLHLRFTLHTNSPMPCLSLQGCDGCAADEEEPGARYTGHHSGLCCRIQRDDGRAVGVSEEGLPMPSVVMGGQMDGRQLGGHRVGSQRMGAVRCGQAKRSPCVPMGPN
jgi:hypothetical protein